MREKQVFSLFFCTAVLFGILFGTVLPVSAAVTDADLANPVVDEGSHSKISTGQNTYIPNKHTSSYRYVYFGSYPQKEISGDELTEAIRNAAYDINGEAEIDGKKYRRLTYEMTTCSASLADDGWHKAKKKEFDSCAEHGYRYFLYEPIKWRILENKSGKLTLFSEMLLDYQAMNSSNSSGQTWKSCEMRSWLNYDGKMESELGKRFRSRGFMVHAFTGTEQSKIQISHLEQDHNPQYTGNNGNFISGGENTDDKIYLLNYSDMGNIVYGFCNKNNICYPQEGWGTDFSYAMAGDSKEYSAGEYGNEYWLRSPGESSYKFMTNNAGECRIFGLPGNTVCYVRPAVNVKCSLQDCIRISFVTNTGAKVEDQILLGSNYAKEPEGLVKEGYVMTGWYTDKACTKPYAFNYRLTEDTVLYAGWKRTQAAPDGLRGGILKISGTTAAMEYAASSDENAVWKPCTKGSTAVPSAGKWYVRYRETEEALAGQAAEVTVISLTEFGKKNGIPEDTLEVTDESITGMKNDGDVKGSSFELLQARADKVTKNSIRLRWKKIKGADGYRIYGNRCGRKNRYRLIKTVKGAGKTTYTGKKLKKGTYYKYIVRAYKELGGEKVTVAVSKTVHAATSGGKYGNAKAVKLNKKKVTLKKGKTCKLKAAEVKKSKKINRHRNIAYASSNKKVATVSKKGVIKAVGKGSCMVYAYAQNGVYQKIRVKVK